MATPITPVVPKPDPAVIQLRLKYVRDHRDAGDAVFDQLNKADSLEKVQAAVARARAWDRGGADLVGDYWGPKTRSYYQTANRQSESYFYPDYMRKLPTEQFFERKEWMNLVRQRQLNLGELASVHTSE